KVLAEAAGKKPRRSYDGPNKMNTWSISVNGGLSKFYGDLQTGDFLRKGPGESTTFAGGVSINKQLSHIFGVSANFGFGNLSGSKDKMVYIDQTVSDQLSYGPNYFKANFLQWNVNAEANIKSLLFGTRKLRRLKVDVFAGIGYLYYNTDVYAIRNYSYLNSRDEIKSYVANERIRFSNGSKSSTTSGDWEGSGTTYSRDLVIPVGLRFLYELSPRFDIGLRYTLNNTFTEKLDMTLGGYDNSLPSELFSSSNGYNNSFKRGPSSYDKYATFAVELTYKLGKKAAKVTKDGKYPTDNGQRYHLRWTDPKDLIPAPYNPTIDTALARVKAIMPPPVDPRLYTDSDGDGVADLFDKEPNTPANSIVSGAGVAMNLADLLKPYVDKKIPKDICTQIFGNVEFKTDQATILPAAKKVLDDLVGFLNQASECRIVVVGNTDRRESDAYNMRLSQRRAMAVKKYLIKAGLKDPSRILMEWYGEFRPKATNATKEGMQENRRVELRVLPGNNWKNYPGN
ncbi:MAG: OmpA family protein, partial [Siphonobacter sp.]